MFLVSQTGDRLIIEIAEDERYICRITSSITSGIQYVTETKRSPDSTQNQFSHYRKSMKFNKIK